MSSYKVTAIDEELNKVYVDLSYVPEGESYPKTLGHYFETDDFSLKNIQVLATEALEKFIGDIDEKLAIQKQERIPQETKDIIGKEFDLSGKEVPALDTPEEPSPVVLEK